MLAQAFALSGIVTLALAGLVASIFMYDQGVPNSLSRYIAPILGGGAFLVVVLVAQREDIVRHLLNQFHPVRDS